MLKQLPVIVGMVGIYFIVPIALARWVVGATWPQIGIAYLILYLGLALMAAGGSTIDEKFGWLLLLGLICSIPGIPTLSWLLGKFGIAS